MQKLGIMIFQSPSEAPNYNDLLAKGEKISALTLTDAYIVKNGTEGGKATIDLLLTDDKGNKFVSMITANLLRSALIVAGSVKASEATD